MKKYRLFSEYKHAVRIGEDFGDALIRGKYLDLPRIENSRGEILEDCNRLRVSKILKVDHPPYKRGGTTVERAIVEFSDGQIKEVDGSLEETF